MGNVPNNLTKFFDIIDKVVYKLRQFPQNHHHRPIKNVLRILIMLKYDAQIGIST